MKSGWLALALTLLLTACTPTGIIPTPTVVPNTTPTQTLSIAHPEDAAPLLQALVSAYQRAYPAVQITLRERADTLGQQALLQDEVDIAVLSWLTPENTSSVWRAAFARDGIAVVVNPQNGVPGLTREQLRELFQGRVEDWTPYGGLPGIPQLISRGEATGEYRSFQELVMGDLPVSLTALLAPNSKAMIDLIAADQQAVGYLSTARLNGQVRALAIDEVPPAPEMLATEAYPMTRNLYLATRDEPQGSARDFIQWTLGAQGQAIVKQQGWIPGTGAIIPRH